MHERTLTINRHTTRCRPERIFENKEREDQQGCGQQEQAGWALQHQQLAARRGL